MNSILNVLADLEGSDIEWLLSNGTELQVISNYLLTLAGKVPSSLFIVLEGLVGVRVDALGNDFLRTLGPGQMVGEMSFLENKPASATVVAIENSLLLAISRSTLESKLVSDPQFAARLYRALARLLSERLRGTMAALSQRMGEQASVSHAVGSRWSVIDAALDEFKRVLAEADLAAIRNDDEVPAEVARDFRERFDKFCFWLNQELGDQGPDGQEVRQELGARVQREVLPYLLLTENGERWYSKPRGYAGDFLSIEWIYNDIAKGSGRLGPLLDRCFLDMHAAKAVRNRRGLLREEVAKTLAEKKGEPAHVLTMACGPARELFDTFESLGDPAQLKATCLDIDLQALAFVGDLRDRKKLKKQMRLEIANLVYLATGRTKLDIPPQDLAYSIGLIDYFNDSFVIQLLNFVFDRLRPGGRVILGNFHPDNPTKAMMDYVLDWKLIHRSEADMNRLFTASKFGRPCDEIRYEAEHINLFAIGSRPME
jgi:extracellular factor (EF) 3-hydroxypalmitic acid methyl ester biosynthesis protein